MVLCTHCQNVQGVGLDLAPLSGVAAHWPLYALGGTIETIDTQRRFCSLPVTLDTEIRFGGKRLREHRGWQGYSRDRNPNFQAAACLLLHMIAHHYTTRLCLLGCSKPCCSTDMEALRLCKELSSIPM